jgi:hypothetical protein
MPKTVNYTHCFNAGNSTVVDKVYYDKRNYELYVLLLNGTLAGYAGVPLDYYQRFAQADSTGHYWNTIIKPRFRGINADVDLVDARPSVPAPTPVWGAHGVANIKNPVQQTEFTVKVEVSGVLTITGAAANGEEALRKVNELLSEQFEGQSKVRELTQKFV